MVNKQTRITDSLIQLCADNIKLGLSYSACAKAIGVTYQTWNRWERLGAEGKSPYAKWLVAIQAAESDLMKECLESVKMSMRLGDVKSAMFLLEKRFSNDGYGKQSQVSMTSQNVNMNYETKRKEKTDDEIRAEILAMLAPKNSKLG